MEILKIDNPFSGGKVFYKDRTDSTMNDARSLITGNPESGTIVMAGEQYSGRGRVEGRKWLGGKDESLMFTLLIREADISFIKTLFPLYAGYCLMMCLEQHYSIKGLVKWPNDVLVDGAKISGILCENTDSYLLCGIGINLNQKSFPLIEGRKAVSVYNLTGEKCAPSDFLIKLLLLISGGLGGSEWIGELEKRLYMRGENVVLGEGLPDRAERIEGIIKGLGDYGQLVILEKGSGKLREVYSGEIF